MKTLPIVWQRLIDEQGDTCPRCAGTGDEVRRAVERLRAILAPMGVEPSLETRAIDRAAFLADPLASNRVLIAGRPLEEWLGGREGQSRCCEACGDADCRTVEVGGRTHEVLPEALLVRAGLIAGSRLLDPSLA